jgi:hypothetical protein
MFHRLNVGRVLVLNDDPARNKSEALRAEKSSSSPAAELHAIMATTVARVAAAAAEQTLFFSWLVKPTV